MPQVFLTYVVNNSLQSILIVGWVGLGHDGCFVVRTPNFFSLYFLKECHPLSVVNYTPLSHERLDGGLQDGGRGSHVTHFVQLYPQPLYAANQVRTISRSWDKGVLNRLMPHPGVNRLMPHPVVDGRVVKNTTRMI